MPLDKNSVCGLKMSSKSLGCSLSFPFADPDSFGAFILRSFSSSRLLRRHFGNGSLLPPRRPLLAAVHPQLRRGTVIQNARKTELKYSTVPRACERVNERTDRARPKRAVRSVAND